MHSSTALGLTELSVDEMAAVVGGEGDCWCKALTRGIGYAIGWVVGSLVDAVVSPDDSNSFLGK